MAGPPKSRGMIMYVLKNMMESFKVNSRLLTFLHSFCYDKVGKREKVGTLMGKDPFGNSYYELPAQPQVENQSNMRRLRQTKIKTLRSWERGCPLGGMTLLKPTEKRFSLVVHDFKADSEQ